jgi:hypothetical protein
MDLSATIEDLEAQGYFLSATIDPETTNSQNAIVHFVLANQPSWHLLLPVVGEDYVAGFASGQSKGGLTWKIAPLSSVARIEDFDGHVLNTRLSKLIQTKLLQAQVTIKQVGPSPLLAAVIEGCSETLCELRVDYFRKVQIPLSSIEFLVVDKLGNKSLA